jgi:hypothetical protein
MSEANIRAFIEPQWFFPLFVVMWFSITALLSRTGGWSSLAKQFRAKQAESGESFNFVSGSMGAKVFPVSYGGCLFITVNNKGFRLSLLFPFRFQSPPLFIPWSQVESIEEKRLFLTRRTVIRVRNQWPIISVRGRAGQSIEEAYARATSSQAL